MAEPEKEIKSTPEGQLRAVMAACIAMEIRAGTNPDEAAAVCYERIKEKTRQKAKNPLQSYQSSERRLE